MRFLRGHGGQGRVLMVAKEHGRLELGVGYGTSKVGNGLSKVQLERSGREAWRFHNGDVDVQRNMDSNPKGLLNVVPKSKRCHRYDYEDTVQKRANESGYLTASPYIRRKVSRRSFFPTLPTHSKTRAVLTNIDTVPRRPVGSGPQVKTYTDIEVIFSSKKRVSIRTGS